MYAYTLTCQYNAQSKKMRAACRKGKHLISKFIVKMQQKTDYTGGSFIVKCLAFLAGKYFFGIVQ